MASGARYIKSDTPMISLMAVGNRDWSSLDRYIYIYIYTTTTMNSVSLDQISWWWFDHSKMNITQHKIEEFSLRVAMKHKKNRPTSNWVQTHRMIIVSNICWRQQSMMTMMMIESRWINHFSLLLYEHLIMHRSSIDQMGIFFLIKIKGKFKLKTRTIRQVRDEMRIET